MLQYADDVAQTLLIASRSPLRGAHAFNLGGNLVDIQSFVAEIDALLPGSAARITIEGSPLPFPEEISDDALAALGAVPMTSIRDGIAATIELLVRQRDSGTLVPELHGL